MPPAPPGSPSASEASSSLRVRPDSATRTARWCGAASSPPTAAPTCRVSVLRGDDSLDRPERALAAWARHVAGDPNGTTADDLDPLRAAGYDDTQILAITLYVGLRIAFSTVNDALGIQPDREYDDPGPVRAGRRASADPSRRWSQQMLTMWTGDGSAR